MNLRQAAEMALKYFEDAHGLEDEEVAIKEALRQALAHEALDRMVAENQKMGLYDEDNLQTAIEKGTKAWADVPNATEWVEELRGNTPDCKTHPDAPHGFDRNASHSADRYVCECESWEPVDWEAVAADQAMTIAMMQIQNKREWVGLTDEDLSVCDEDGVLLARYWEAKLKEKNIAPYAKNDTTAGVLHKKWVDRLVRIMGTFDLATGHADTLDQALDSLEEELRDVLGYLRARREWVGLTDEEIAQYWGDTHAGNTRYVQSFARALEATLKEKNGG